MISRRSLLVATPTLLLPRRALCQIGPLPGMLSGGFMGGAPATRAFGSSASQGAVVGGNVTFSGMSFGSPAANRYIVAAVTVMGSSCVASTVTIGGVSATEVAHVLPGGAFGESSLWIAAVPTGSTGNVAITVTNGGNNPNMAAATYALYNINSPTPSTTATSTAGPPSASLAVPARGVAVAAATSGASGSAGVWGADFTVDAQISFVSPKASCASAASPSGGTLTATCNFSAGSSNQSLAAAAWNHA